jgi:lysophospholipase L1-like esterase
LTSLRSTRSGAAKVVATLIIIFSAPLAILGLAGVSRAGAVHAPTYFYLDLGASASVGFQPTPADPRGEPTSHGYSNDIVKYEAARGIKLPLTELGCPGETTTTMLYGGGTCYGPGDSQLHEATNFLYSHFNDIGIVTLDLGFNDLRPCIVSEAVDETCVQDQLSAIQVELPTILKQLKGAAGPRVTFIALDHYDPYLAYEAIDPSAATFTSEAGDVVDRLNIMLDQIYLSAGVPVAQVDTAFQSQDHTRTRLKGVGEVPENVSSVCELTWMCQPAPYGPNFHPNDAGYALIARTIESVLPFPF